MRPLLLSLFSFFYTLQLHAQDLPATRAVAGKLSSETFWGRGYVRQGMEKAAIYLSAEFRNCGLQPLDGNDFTQEFGFPVNTFPGAMHVRIDNKTLVPGKDFIVFPASASLKAESPLGAPDSTGNVYAIQAHRLMVSLRDKLTWAVSREQTNYTGLEILKTAMPQQPATIELDIESRLIADFRAANICGIVKGTSRPDSLLLFTAHYDHLGGMGKDTYFPGANDNASGTAMLLDLARFYARNPQRYSVGFICFAAEEAGLLGSRYYTENPIFPLSKVRFLINLDMVGTGEKGIAVVNATLHPREFAILQQLNDQNNYLPEIRQRGKSANSDHYFFSEKGVPAFFIYTQGGPEAYHDINDRPANLTFTVYENLFRLFTGFYRQLMN
ncbi:M28 family peptidase [Pedobacter sp. JY14-1]|uniref:M28 family metallopeptidase n=1 Tax=Pedobacter sp. JY14-1 TaxID=3034151 RepID=UPI0023E35119|nr:M28 family peptidase [Pedobacter sp. JY14-1]